MAYFLLLEFGFLGARRRNLELALGLRFPGGRERYA